jgi:formate dehydrogenase subunit beta
MPINAGRALSAMTINWASETPLAAVLKPCELRAFIELVKRAQGSLENILLISHTCGGVYPLSSIVDGQWKKNLDRYRDALKNAESDPGIRPTCLSCENFVPEAADVTLAAVGQPHQNGECLLALNTKKGELLASNESGSIASAELESAAIDKLKQIRIKQKEQTIGNPEHLGTGYEALVRTFAPCLGCHACGEACPICHCILCDFDNKTCEYKPENIESDLEPKGGFKVPPGTLFYHLGRMSHMAVSCVHCGMCSDVCPVDIPVAEFFTRVGASLQESLAYHPGEELETPVPSGTYKEDEFREIGEQ